MPCSLSRKAALRLSQQKTLQSAGAQIPTSFRRCSATGYSRWRFDGKLVEAIQFIEHAIALDPNNSRLRQNCGGAVSRFGRCDRRRVMWPPARFLQTPYMAFGFLFLCTKAICGVLDFAAYDESGSCDSKGTDDPLPTGWRARRFATYAIKEREICQPFYRLSSN